MKIERSTEEEFLTVLDDFGPWNQDTFAFPHWILEDVVYSMALDPHPVDSDELADTLHLYVEVNPWQHYRVTFCPSRDKWLHILEKCYELAMNDDPETFYSYNQTSREA